MLEILSSFTVLIEFFLFVVVGFVCRKLKAFDEGTIKGGTDLLLKVGVPGAIFASAESVVFDAQTIWNILFMFFLYAVWFGCMIPMMHLASRTPLIAKEDRKAFVGTTVFKNISFMGIPLCAAVLGGESVFYVAICMTVYNFLHWSYGIYLYSGGHGLSLKTMASNIPMLSVFVMLLIKACHIPLPQILWDTFSAAGSICTPVSLVIVGVMLAGVDLKVLFVDKALYLASGCTLVAAPLIAWIVVQVFGATGEIAAVLILLSLTPSASMNAVLAKRYGKNGEYVSLMLLQTLLLSLATIPLLAATVFRSFF